jgi:signal transduction histidine kinase
MEERRRIARDVHDVIAHSLSVTLLHLNSARMLLDEDPAASVEVLDEAVQHGRKSLGEVRQVVGLLSEPSGIEVPGDPTAAAAAVEELVADYRGAGLDVELHLDVAMEHMGLLASTPTGVWGTGYRLIQEALANVVKHSPGMRADIVVQVSDDALLIEITNPLPPGVVPLEHSGGYGLRGMRERAEMLGGRVDVGADTAPCGLMWRVRAELPLDVRRVPQSRWSAFVGGMS